MFRDANSLAAKGSACSLVAFGCNLLFEKRGGIALLHFGVALLMISELQVGLLAKENMLSLVEGESSVFVRDIRERELAIIVPKSETEDRVIVIPEAKLLQSADAGAKAGTSTPGSDAIAAKQVISLAEHDVPLMLSSVSFIATAEFAVCFRMIRFGRMTA